uniref:CLIP domain-containing serine protease n=1 Tax=Corethrella appendiculata TaxID=1370023 RepID=U5EYJ2_9DIPT
MQKIILIIIVAFGVQAVLSGEEVTCKTPNNEDGACIPIRQCQKMYNARRSKVKDRQYIDYISKSICENPNEAIQCVCCKPEERFEVTTTTSTTTAPRIQNFRDVLNIEEHPNIQLFDTNNCGKTTTDRLSYGEKTDLFEFPWMAALGYRNLSLTLDEPRIFLCGGTLINSFYVLTAAHCILKENDPKLRLEFARLGEHDFATTQDCKLTDSGKICARPVQDIPIDKTIQHPDYNHPRYNNDIALIRLKNQASISKDDVVPVCLPITEKLKQKQYPEYIITGWGTTENYTTSTVLMRATIPFVEMNVCQQKLKAKNLFVDLADDKQFCAGGHNNIDTCRGDSGGPLLVMDELNEPQTIQIGVVAFGVNSCGIANIPGVYTKVQYFVRWILDHMEA